MSLLGIDLGSSYVKVALFSSDDLHTIAGIRKPVTKATSLTQWRRIVQHSCARLRQDHPQVWQQLTGIGVAAPADSLVMVNTYSGAAQSHIVTWQDPAPTALLERLTALQSCQEWQRSNVMGIPQSSLARRLYLEHHHGFGPASLIVSLGEALVFDLTGCWRQSRAIASVNGVWNFTEQELDTRPLELAGGQRSSLAPLASPRTALPCTQACRAALSLPENVQVLGPWMDHEALHALSSALNPGTASTSLGTAFVSTTRIAELDYAANVTRLTIPEDSTFQSIRVAPAGGQALQQLVVTHAQSFKQAQAIMDSSFIPAQLVAADICNPGAPPAADLFREGVLTIMLGLIAAIQDLIQNKTITHISLAGGAAQLPYVQKLLAGLMKAQTDQHLPCELLSQSPYAVAAASVHALADTLDQCLQPSQLPSQAEYEQIRHYLHKREDCLHAQP